jgi:hypothetical protein
MLIEGNPTPQSSGSSTRIESIGMGSASLRHISGLSNLDKASFFLPPNSAVAFEHFAMDVDDIAQSTDDPIAG